MLSANSFKITIKKVIKPSFFRTMNAPRVSPERCLIKLWNNQSEIQKPSNSHHVTYLKCQTSKINNLPHGNKNRQRKEQKVQTAARIWFKPPLQDTLRKPLLIYFPATFQELSSYLQPKSKYLKYNSILTAWKRCSNLWSYHTIHKLWSHMIGMH
jgi:hypothetical protein